MARGAPDYVTLTGGRTAERYFSYSEIQVPIAMFDDFEATNLKWIQSNGTITRDTTGSTTTLTSPVWNGNACLKMLSAAGGVASIERDIPIPEQTTNVGFSYYFWSSSFAKWRDTDDNCNIFYIMLYTGSTRKSILINYNAVTYNWKYSNDEANSWNLIVNRRLRAGTHHYVKLLIDYSNDKVIYFFLDGVKYDLSSVSLYTTDDLGLSHLSCQIYAQAAVGEQADLYIDDYKVTYNEPA